jgi:hypothetical protein
MQILIRGSANVSSLTLVRKPGLEDQPWDEAYSPGVIRFWLGREGREILYGTPGAVSQRYEAVRSRGDRLSIICIKADLERAADSLPLHWRTTSRIFRLQRRWGEYLEKCRNKERGGLFEQMSDTDAFDEAVELMARSLGWRPREERKPAA